MKKIVSFILTLTLLLGVTAGAAPTTASSLEDAIAVVRSVVDISDEMVNFNTSSDTYTVNGVESTVWYLNWSDENYDKYMSAMVDSNGNLIYFYQHDWTSYDSQTGLARVTRAQAEKTADAFLQKALPEYYADMKQVNEEENAGVYFSGHEFSYQLYHNDIPVSSVSAYITINKYTGEIENYSGIDRGAVVSNDYPQGDAIDKSQAVQTYLDEFGMVLQYRSYYNYKTKEFSVYPVYQATNTYSKAIDALSGDVISINDDDTDFGWIRSYSDASVAGSNYYYSYAERQTMETLQNVISKEEAEQILRDAMDDLTDDTQIYGIDLYQDDVSGGYIWELYFDNGYGMVDAQSGKVKSFYSYMDYESEEVGTMDLAAAKAKAETFMQTQEPEVFAQVVDINTLQEPVDSANSRYIALSYARYVNGIPFYDNGFYIVLDTVTGSIVEYSVSWYEDLDFPAIDSVISEQSAFEVVDAQAQLDLVYVSTKAGTKLVYAFVDSPYLCVNALTGKMLDYNGNVYTGSMYVPNYVDIDMHWSYDIVNELKANGYFLDGEEFRPDDAITRRDFIRYIVGYWWNQDSDESVDSYAKSMGYVLDGEDMDAELTRYDAAKIIIRYYNLSLAADQSDAFKNDFNDSIADGYLGYAMLCKSLGIMSGDASGNFNGVKVMTRAEAASTIYNMFTRI